MTEHRMHRLLRHLFLLALLCFAPLALWGEGKAYTPELVPKVFATDSTRLFSDPEGYVSPEGRERIDAALYELRRRNGVEFATVILPSIGERDIESFSTDLFRLWGIGSKTRNDGLLLLIVMDQRKVRFETGYGLEGILPDVLASRIQRQEILPRMRQGDYEGAIYNGVIAVGKVIQGEGYTSDRRTAQGTEEFPTRILLVLYALTVLAAGYSAFSSLREEELRTRNTRHPLSPRGATLPPLCSSDTGCSTSTCYPLPPVPTADNDSPIGIRRLEIPDACRTEGDGGRLPYLQRLSLHPLPLHRAYRSRPQQPVDVLRTVWSTHSYPGES